MPRSREVEPGTGGDVPCGLQPLSKGELGAVDSDERASQGEGGTLRCMARFWYPGGSHRMDFYGGGRKTDPFAYLDACDGSRVDLVAAHWHACGWPAPGCGSVSWRAPMHPAARCSP